MNIMYTDCTAGSYVVQLFTGEFSGCKKTRIKAALLDEIVIYIIHIYIQQIKKVN